MAGADAGRCRGGRGAAAWLTMLLLVSAGCSAVSSHDEAPADAPVPAGVEVPPPPPGSGPTTKAVARVAQTATRIERVTIDSAPPTTRVVLQLDGTAEPEVSLLANQRLVVDVPHTTCASLPRVIEAPGDPLVERVRTGQHGPPEDKSRIVIDLRSRADFSVRAQGDRIIAYLAPADTATGAPAAGDQSRVLFGAEGGATGTVAPDALAAVAAPLPSPAPVAAPAATTAPPPPPEPEATATPAVVAIATAEPFVEATPVPVAPATTLEPAAAASAEPLAAAPSTPDTAAPSDRTAALDTAPGAAPLETPPVSTPAVETAPWPSASLEPAAGTPVAGSLPDAAAAPSPPAAPATTWTPAEVPVAAPAADAPLASASPEGGAMPSVEATRSTSKRISIDFTEADVRTVIELIAGAGGYRVLFTPDVGGTITISLVDRPWEDALQTVLRARRLREVRHEDVMLVSPVGR